VNEQVRPFFLMGASELEAVQVVVSPALASWAEEWLARDGDAVVNDIVALAVDAAGPSMTEESWRESVAGLWFNEAADGDQLLGAAVTGASWATDGFDSDPWLGKMLSQARETRNRAVRLALGLPLDPDYRSGPARPLPFGVLQPGSGAVRIMWPGVGLDAVASALVLNPILRSAASRVPRGISPLQPLSTATLHASAHVIATLGSIEIDAGTLLDFRAGDVLRLARHLGDAVDVTCGGVTLCRAHLGQLDGRKAVQLLSNSTNAPEPTHV